MRTAPVVLGFLLGFSAAVFSGCPATTACSAASCPLGCCDASGRCQSSSPSTCGTSGAVCKACSLGESCSVGVCVDTNGSGGGNASGGSSGVGGGSTAGGSSGVGGGSSTSTYGAFIDSFASAFCAKAIECAQLPGGQSECVTLYRNVVASGGTSAFASERSVRGGAATFDAARGQTCLADIGRAVCPTSGLTANCADVTRPAAAEGATCFSRYGDCIDSRLGCNGAPCSRRCTAGGSLGESCRGSALACDAPFACIDGVCQAQPAPGTPCTGSECGPLMRCRSNVCERLPTAGQACLDFSCVPSAYCDSSRICRARKAAGVSCLGDSECSDGTFCRTVCTALGTPGALCRDTDECVATASCFRGSCRTRGATGAPCANYLDCENGSCDDVTRLCAVSAPVGPGQACSSARYCSSPEVCRNKVVPADGGVATPGRCGPPQLGDDCFSGYQCAERQTCDDTSNTCVAATRGGPCDTDSNCPSGDYCTAARICAQRAATGQICERQRSSCATAREVCLLTSTPGEYRCQPLPGLGAACVETCAFPTACVNRTCVAAGRPGQPCLTPTADNCLTGICLGPDGGFASGADGRCAQPLANGARCSYDSSCQSGFCDRIGGSVCRPSCN